MQMWQAMEQISGDRQPLYLHSARQLLDQFDLDVLFLPQNQPDGLGLVALMC